MRIAIMQPYFLPYAGYFRLFQQTDLFVIYDCVQFTRRGWIHRNQLKNNEGNLDWLTLPLTKAPRDVRISELAFSQDAITRMREQFAKFPVFGSANYLTSEIHHVLTAFLLHPVLYISRLLQIITEMLQIPFNIAYSSQLNIPSELKSQERILFIAKHFNAERYLNPPGGRDLYNESDFKKQNIQLEFLNDYAGSYESILPRLFKEDRAELRHEIVSQ